MSEKRKLELSEYIVVVLFFLIVSVICVLLFFLTRSSFFIGSKPMKFGASYRTMDNDYFLTLNSTIKEVIETNGDRLIVRDPILDQDKQNEQIQDMLNAGVKLIFLNPVNSEKITSALIACKNHHVPVIVVDSGVLKSEYVATTITSDNYDAGVQIADDIMKKKINPRVFILKDENIESTQMRIRGVLDTFDAADYTYRIVGSIPNTFSVNKSMLEMYKILDRGTKFDILIGCNDPAALGALAAFQKYSRASCLIYGVDGSPDAKSMIQQGAMTGSCAQYPQKMGRYAAGLAYQILAGKTVQKRILLPVKLITTKNIEDFDVLDWQ